MIDCLTSFNLRGEVCRAIEKNKGAMVLLNLDQLYHGLNTEGEHFQEYAVYKMDEEYTYAEYKHELNHKPGEGNPDLKLTGEFYKAMFARLEGDDIIMDSTDEKSEWLQYHYSPEDNEGSTIFGLLPKNKETFITVCAFPDFSKVFTNYTGLKIK